jgi:WS/DGAT/MGAT family acyltransferase
MRQLSALDRLFLTQESARTPAHLSALLFYSQQTARGGRVRLRDIVNVFAERAHEVPFLHCRVQEVPFGLDNPYWVHDEHFNVESHVNHVALPKPGDWRQLCIMAARIHARPVDRSRPLWEATVIEGLDNIEFLPRGSFAILLKVHHAAVDGIAALKALERLHDTAPDAVHEDSGEPDTDDRVLPTGEMLGRAGLHALGTPLRWGRLAGSLVPALGRMVSAVREQRGTRAQGAVNTRFNGRISSYRVVESTFFPLAELKAIRAAVPHSTMNDVVVTVIGGAMRKYLQSRGELGDVSPVTIAPLSVREAEARELGGNMVSAMAFPIHTTIEDPLERLAAVQRDSAGAKQIAEALGPRNALELLEAVPPQLASLGFLELGTRLLMATGIAMPVNTVITNVPGPQVPLYLAGARLVTMAGFGPIMDSMGLFHAVMSYDGKVSIAINSCREMMPDPAFYAECIVASFEELRDAATAELPRGATKRAPARAGKAAPRARKPARAAAGPATRKRAARRAARRRG